MLAIGLSIMKSMAPGKPTLNVVSTCIFEYWSHDKEANSPKYDKNYHLSQTICCQTYYSIV